MMGPMQVMGFPVAYAMGIAGMWGLLDFGTVSDVMAARNDGADAGGSCRDNRRKLRRIIVFLHGRNHNGSNAYRVRRSRPSETCHNHADQHVGMRLSSRWDGLICVFPLVQP